MNCNAKSLCITSIMLMTMSKNPALSQKVLENWLRLPESQELFAGLVVHFKLHFELIPSNQKLMCHKFVIYERPIKIKISYKIVKLLEGYQSLLFLTIILLYFNPT